MPRRASPLHPPVVPAREEPAHEPVRRNHPETILLAAGVVLIGLLCFSIYPSLSPFVILAGLLILLYPLRREQAANRILWLAVFLFAVWFFSAIMGVLAPFLIAFLLAYILNPLAVGLERRHIPRWVSSLSVVLLMCGAVVTAGLFIVPVAIDQFQSITGKAGAFAGDASRALGSGPLADFLGRFGVTGEKAKETLIQNLTPKLEEILKRIFDALFDVVTGVSSIAHQLLNIIIVPFVLFYLLLDFPVIVHRSIMLVPEKSRERFIELAKRADSLMGRYFRGAILVAAIQGTISGLVLWLIGVDYAVVLGLMTGVLDFIPYVGLAISLVVSSIVALFSGGDVWTKVLFIVIMYLGQKVLEATVLGPKILGPQVGIHPVLLILCLLVFGYFLGLIGVLIAVPATALMIAGVKEWNAARRQGAEPMP